MPISVQCPECYKQYRIKDEFAGMRMRCTQCGHSFQVPSESVDGIDSPNPTTVRTSSGGATPATPFDAERTAVEPHAYATPTPMPQPAASPSAPPPSPPPTPAVRQPAENSGTINFGIVLDFAQDWSMVSFVLEWVGLCAIAAFLAGGLSYLIPVIGPILGGLVLLVTLCTAALGVICGVSHMTGVKLSTGTAPNTTSAWNLFQRRFFSLTIGTLGIWIATILVMALAAGLITFLSYSPYVGQLLGGVLLIPTFVGVIFAFALLFNLYLLPVAIGVDDCSAGEAFGRLREIVATQRFALYARYFSAAFALIPAIITTLLMTAVPLAISLSVCGVRMWIDGPGIESALLLFSTSAIVLSAIAYGVVLVTVAMALVYCQSASRATVYRQ